MRMSENKELAFFVEHKRNFDARAFRILRELVCVIPDGKVTIRPTLRGQVVEVGSRMSMVSPWSSSAVEILRGCGIKAERFEMLRRVVVPKDTDSADLFDRMTEQLYDKHISTFEQKMEIPKVQIVPVLKEGKDALHKFSVELGLGWDEQDVGIYHHLFVDILKRNPTNVELFLLGQVNSNHSRHLDWNAIWTINGVEQKETLFNLIKKPYLADHGNALVAFYDNSSVIAGYPIKIAVPKYPWKSSEYVITTVRADGTLTFETHNHPTGVAPHPGAGTGTGGRMRDQKAVGIGGRLLAACAGFLTANLNLPGYRLPWENRNQKYPTNLATAANIQRLASDGACEYNNPVGEPVILGCKRAVEMRLPSGIASDGEKIPRRLLAWLKPIMASGGIGYIRREHIKKLKSKKGWRVVMIGGPAINVGFAGGSASSQFSGDNKAGLDYNSVQRADPEMAIRDHRVIDACIALGRENPICVIHDQGAGGVLNNLIELIDPVGGVVHAGKINLGDKYLPFIVIVGAEFQERYGLLLKPSGLPLFRKICEREKCLMEELGRITGDGKFIICNEIEGDYKKPIDFKLSDVMAGMPRKRFSDKKVQYKFKPLILPSTATIKSALNRVLKNLAVASAEMYTLKGDRSVGGLVVGQQHCGPVNLPVADCGIMALSHFSSPGMVFSMGEQPLKLMLDPAAGARMAAAEALLNMAGAKVSAREDIKSSVNWMWALKYLGEGSAIFRADGALSEFLTGFGAPVRGKDSSSMLTRFNGEIVPCPREVMITMKAMMPNVRNFVTPDFKQPGESDLLLIDLGLDKNRIGGSILAQCYNQWGDDCPDIESDLLKRTFDVIQSLVLRGLILSYHDRSDGGLIVTLLEMAFAGNCGFEAKMRSRDILRVLFSEEAGAVLEVDPALTHEVSALLKMSEVPAAKIGATVQEKTVGISTYGKSVFSGDMVSLRQTWRETSYQLRRLQMNPDCALEEKKNTRARKGISYVFPEGWDGKARFKPKLKMRQPKVAILREIGTNSDQEMVAAFKMAGFCPVDLAMRDLENGAVKNLNQFSVLAACGGFSDGDVLGSARGWASKILYNEKLLRIFLEFMKRDDALSYWVCNGAQLAGQLGWIPYMPENGRPAKVHPLFTYNTSKKFEARWSTVEIGPSPSIMLRGLEGSRLGVHVAHGEGRLYCSDSKLLGKIVDDQLAPVRFVDDSGQATEQYPFNPNGSPMGITSLCSPNGQHLATMPHLERSGHIRQWQYVPEALKHLENSPWLRAFENMRSWYK